MAVFKISIALIRCYPKLDSSENHIDDFVPGQLSTDT